MTMFVKVVDVLKRAKNYCFTDWGKEGRIQIELDEYRRIEHLDEPTQRKKINFKR
jgi:hypothetical protein|tara:strand:- start:1708 stop:1872 length:165 start_codon:yes stop_codon:yes gene_type:complete